MERREVFHIGSFTVLGAIVMLTGWFALVEYDQYPESEQKEVVARIKSSPVAKMVIAFMPVGIVMNMLGNAIGSFWMVLLGATFIFVQSIIVSLLFWRRKRWKSIVLLVAMVVLGLFLYMPLFI